jgi:methionine-S-sulfoxide reductase
MIAGLCLAWMLFADSTAHADEESSADALKFKMKSIVSRDVSLSDYHGDVVLAVNVASKCGYTKQYADLQKLHEKYADQGLAILAFPCNQFGGQEPGTRSQIAEFCSTKFHVSFDLFDKVDVNGNDACQLYKHLTGSDAAIEDQGPIKWNFEKFLIDHRGKVIQRFRSAVSPTDPQMIKAIEKAIAAAPPRKHAILAGGCFWCTEAVFEQLQGVYSVESGYAGGKKENADYKKVSAGITDHAEVIRITYDPDRISYDKLLEVFFTVAHDPTQLNRQGNDMGKQYRSAVFFADEKEKKAAQSYIQKLTDQKKYDSPIVTTLEELDAFYLAESYHQDYVQHNPSNPYVASQALPKVQKVRKKYSGDVKK